MKKIIGFLLLALIMHSGPAAQNSTITDSTEFAFLPALSYNSDFGLIGGGLANWYIYKNGTRPFHSYISTAGIVSTKGLASFELKVSKPQIFGTHMRLDTETFIFRFFEENFYGIGNYEELQDTPDGQPDYYLFKTFGAGFRTDLRMPVYTGSDFDRMDLLAILNVHYETPWDNEPDRLITQPSSQPPGYRGGTSLQLGTGFIWEGRNSEFRPTSGAYAASSVELGNVLWGSSFNSLIADVEVSQYLTFHLIKDVTFANRLTIRHTSGDVPYWQMAYAGDDNTLRGYPARRFLDDNSVILNSELRTWLFEIPSISTQFGGTLFFDLGRTFSNVTPFTEWSKDLKYSFGFGGTASPFTPEFIIRGDVGFSEEDIGIYITTGYMF